MPSKPWYARAWRWCCRPYWRMRGWWRMFRGHAHHEWLAMALGYEPPLNEGDYPWPPPYEQLAERLLFIKADCESANHALDEVAHAFARNMDGIMLERQDLPEVARNITQQRDRYNALRKELQAQVQDLKGHSAR